MAFGPMTVAAVPMVVAPDAVVVEMAAAPAVVAMK
jgi:hypothetical protein